MERKSNFQKRLDKALDQPKQTNEEVFKSMFDSSLYDLTLNVNKEIERLFEIKYGEKYVEGDVRVSVEGSGQFCIARFNGDIVAIFTYVNNDDCKKMKLTTFLPR